MKNPFGPFASKLCAGVLGLSMLLGAAPATAAEVVSAVEVEQEPGGEGAICDVCGPAPCCVLLWTAWCGCPFGGKDDRVVSQADSFAAEGLMACGSNGQERGLVSEGRGDEDQASTL